MIASVWQTALTIAFGALAGGLTNSLAIWMVFHPYTPPRLFGRRLRFLQGAIPKNKARLAAAIGRAVGTRLLTGEDLARTLRQPPMRAAFDERLAAFLRAALDRPRGALAEELAPTLVDELRDLLDDAVEVLLERLDGYLAGDEFRRAADRWAETLADELRDQVIGEVLTPDRGEALARTADRWIAEAVAGQGLERAVRDYLDRTAERLLEADGDRTFEDVLPPGLVAAVERAIAGYLPLALERLGGLLEEPDARERLERVLHEILDRFMRDLKFHQRLVAALVITPETVDRVLRAIEAEGAEKVSETLHDPAVREATARRINAAVADFLRRPVASVIGRPGDPSVEDAKETIAGWVLSLARDAQTRAFLVEKLETTLEAAEERTWGDIFRRVPPERIAGLVVAAARSDEARTLYREALDRVAAHILERPLGRPADYLPADTAERLERALADPLWEWLQEQVPIVAQRVDIAGRVEEKILAYPMPKVEELIRSVTERELHLIVRLGYVVGAVIGTALVAVNAVLA